MSGFELELETETELVFACKLVGGEEIGAGLAAEHGQLPGLNWEVEGNPPLLLLVLDHWLWVAIPIKVEQEEEL